MFPQEIQGRTVVLKKITQQDLAALYEWRNTVSFRVRCTHRRTRISYDEFVDEMRGDFFYNGREQFLIFRKKENLPVGTIYVYNTSHADRHCFISAFVLPRYRNVGIGIRAAGLLLEHLFTRSNLYKVYMDVYSYNKTVTQALERIGATPEGTFHGHRLLRNRRYDVCRFAIYPDILLRHQTFFQRSSRKP